MRGGGILAMVLVVFFACGGAQKGPVVDGAFEVRMDGEPGSDGTVVLSAEDVAGVVRARGGDSGNAPAIHVLLTDDAAARFEEVTRARVGERLVIEVGGDVVATLIVRDPVAGGRVEITAHSDAKIEEMYRVLVGGDR